MKNFKTSIIIAVSTGLLTGFVLGAAFYTQQENGTKIDGSSAKGNVAELSRLRYNKVEKTQAELSGQDSDTLRFEAVDQNGENWNITITK